MTEDKRFVGKTCGERARFEVPDSGCPWRGKCTAIDKGCSEFYPLPKAQKKKEKKPPHRACGLSDEGPYEAIYHQGEPAFFAKTSGGFKVLETVTNEGKSIALKDLMEIPYEPYGV